MSIKAELKRVVDQHRKALQEAISQVQNDKGSGQYTPLGIQKRVEEINGSFGVTAIKNRETALALIEQAEKNFTDTNRSHSIKNLHDSGYQEGLSNVIRMLEKGILSENDFHTVIEAYKDDSISMRAIKEAVTGNHENRALMSLLPVTQDDQQQFFEKLRKNAIKSIAPVSVESNTGALMGLSWILMVMERVDENLILLQ